MLTKLNVYACFTVKIYKNKPVIFFKTGGGGPVLDPPLTRMISRRPITIIYHYCPFEGGGCSSLQHTYYMLFTSIYPRGELYS